MKKKSSKILVTIAFMAAFIPVPRTPAQTLSDNGIFYHAFASPWSSSLNPAMFPESAKWYVSIARTNADLSLPFSFSDLNLQEDPVRHVTVFNTTDFLQLIADRKFRFSLNSDINLLGIGFSIGQRLHFTLDAGARVNGIVTLPIELTRILTEGNLNENRHLELGTTLPAHAMAYAYASAGIAYRLSDFPLTLGARFNMLGGIAMASIDHLTVDINTAADTSSMSLTMDYLAHSSIPAPLTDDVYMHENTLLPHFLPENLGFTFDLGAKFTLFNIDISASLLDLGPGITWSDYATVITPPADNHPIQFDGFDISRIREKDYFTGWADTLLHRLDCQLTPQSFRFTPPTRMFLGASFSLLKTLKIGYLFHGEVEGGLFNDIETGAFRMNNSVSLNASLFDWIELTVANSVAYDGDNWNFFNPGLALSVNPFRSLQLYVAADYVSSLKLVDMRAAHLYFGINLYGHR